ncbi:MAG: 6-phospho-3-hexuloisomerase [Anaerolineae bacterium]|nr:6-phospho-3-hexuloisomerase [Anaerolineae bacterium]
MTDYGEWVEIVTGEVRRTLERVPAGELARLREAIRGAKRVFVAGKGRSGLFMRGFAMRLMHQGFTVSVVDEVTTPAIQAGDLLILASGSGKTPSVVQYATKAKGCGAQVALFTAFPDSPTAQQADLVIHVPAPSVKGDGVSGVVSAQPMANLFEQSLTLLLDITTLLMMAEIGVDGEQMFSRHANLE